MMPPLSWRKLMSRWKDDGRDGNKEDPQDVQSERIDAGEPTSILICDMDSDLPKQAPNNYGPEIIATPTNPLYMATRSGLLDAASGNISSAYEECAKSPSVLSETTYYTAQTHSSSYYRRRKPNYTKYTAYQKALQSKGLWPVNKAVEQDWSGRGQHVEFQERDRKFIEEYLPVIASLGHGSSGMVQSVKCRRILLARKTVRCNRRMKRETALDEVAHLSRLQHSHIVRVIGTYVLGHDLSILLYPVAQNDLESFLLETIELKAYHVHRWSDLFKFVGCLANALDYLHSNLLKHMDIKPRNILVTQGGPSSGIGSAWTVNKVYITDFGISRSYTTLEEAETEGPTTFTRKYAAPEVVDYQPRGFPADVFSLGCVFVEILTTLADIVCTVPVPVKTCWEQLVSILEANEIAPVSFYANIECVRNHLGSLFQEKDALLHELTLEYLQEVADLTRHMINPDPKQRPVASTLVREWGSRECCNLGPDKLNQQ